MRCKGNMCWWFDKGGGGGRNVPDISCHPSLLVVFNFFSSNLFKTRFSMTRSLHRQQRCTQLRLITFQINASRDKQRFILHVVWDFSMNHFCDVFDRKLAIYWLVDFNCWSRGCQLISSLPMILLMFFNVNFGESLFSDSIDSDADNK